METPGTTVNRRRVYRAARVALKESGIEAPWKRAIELCAFARGVTVREADLQGADAILVRTGNVGIITVACRLGHCARRFAIAHELGHFDLHAGTSHLGLCTGELSPSAYAKSPFELEASSYAAEYLMPRKAWLAYARDAEGSWDVVKDLAHAFDVSLTAAALRFVELSQRRVACVAMRDGKVAWAARSWRFGSRIERGRPLPEASAAHAANELWPDTRRELDARAWMDGASEGTAILEHAFAMPQGRYPGTVMLMLEATR